MDTTLASVDGEVAPNTSLYHQTLSADDIFNLLTATTYADFPAQLQAPNILAHVSVPRSEPQTSHAPSLNLPDGDGAGSGGQINGHSSGPSLPASMGNHPYQDGPHLVFTSAPYHEPIPAAQRSISPNLLGALDPHFTPRSGTPHHGFNVIAADQPLSAAVQGPEGTRQPRAAGLAAAHPDFRPGASKVLPHRSAPTPTNGGHLSISDRIHTDPCNNGSDQQTYLNGQVHRQPNGSHFPCSNGKLDQLPDGQLHVHRQHAGKTFNTEAPSGTVSVAPHSTPLHGHCPSQSTTDGYSSIAFTTDSKMESGLRGNLGAKSDGPEHTPVAGPLSVLQGPLNNSIGGRITGPLVGSLDGRNPLSGMDDQETPVSDGQAAIPDPTPNPAYAFTPGSQPVSTSHGPGPNGEVNFSRERKAVPQSGHVHHPRRMPISHSTSQLGQAMPHGHHRMPASHSASALFVHGSEKAHEAAKVSGIRGAGGLSSTPQSTDEREREAKIQMQQQQIRQGQHAHHPPHSFYPQQHAFQHPHRGSLSRSHTESHYHAGVLAHHADWLKSHLNSRSAPHTPNGNVNDGHSSVAGPLDQPMDCQPDNQAHESPRSSFSARPAIVDGYTSMDGHLDGHLDDRSLGHTSGAEGDLPKFPSRRPSLDSHSCGYTPATTNKSIPHATQPSFVGPHRSRSALGQNNLASPRNGQTKIHNRPRLTLQERRKLTRLREARANLRQALLEPYRSALEKDDDDSPVATPRLLANTPAAAQHIVPQAEGLSASGGKFNRDNLLNSGLDISSSTSASDTPSPGPGSRALNTAHARVTSRPQQYSALAPSTKAPMPSTSGVGARSITSPARTKERQDHTVVPSPLRPATSSAGKVIPTQTQRAGPAAPLPPPPSREQGWESVVPPRDHREAMSMTAYSSTGFDMLSALLRVASRPNPVIRLGPVDLSAAFTVADINLPDAPLVYCSDTFLRLTGYERHEVIGRNCRFLQSPTGVIHKGQPRTDTDEGAVAHMARHMSSLEECQVSLINYRKGGQPFLNLLSLIPIPWGTTTNARYVVGFQTDLAAHPGAVLEPTASGEVALNYRPTQPLSTRSGTSTGGGTNVPANTSHPGASHARLAPDSAYPSVFGPTTVTGPWNAATALNGSGGSNGPSTSLMNRAATHSNNPRAIENARAILRSVYPSSPSSEESDSEARPMARQVDWAKIVLENNPDIIFVLSLKGTVLYISPTVERVAGWHPAEMTGRSIGEFIHPADVVPVFRELKDSTSTQAIQAAIRAGQAKMNASRAQAQHAQNPAGGNQEKSSVSHGHASSRQPVEISSSPSDSGQNGHKSSEEAEPPRTTQRHDRKGGTTSSTAPATSDTAYAIGNQGLNGSSASTAHDRSTGSARPAPFGRSFAPTVHLLFRMRIKRSLQHRWVESTGRMHIDPGKGRKVVVSTARPREVHYVPARVLTAVATSAEPGFWARVSKDTGIFLSITAPVVHLLGITAQQLTGRSAKDLSSPEGAAALITALHTSQTSLVKFALRDSMGQRVPLLAQLYPTAYPSQQTAPEGASAPSLGDSEVGAAGDSRSVWVQVRRVPPNIALEENVVYTTDSMANSATSNSSQPASPYSVRGQPNEGVFSELNPQRAASWQYELHQLKHLNRRLRQDVQKAYARRRGPILGPKTAAHLHAFPHGSEETEPIQSTRSSQEPSSSSASQSPLHSRPLAGTSRIPRLSESALKDMMYPPPFAKGAEADESPSQSSAGDRNTPVDRLFAGSGSARPHDADDGDAEGSGSNNESSNLGSNEGSNEESRRGSGSGEGNSSSEPVSHSVGSGSGSGSNSAGSGSGSGSGDSSGSGSGSGSGGTTSASGSGSGSGTNATSSTGATSVSAGTAAGCAGSAATLGVDESDKVPLPGSTRGPISSLDGRRTMLHAHPDSAQGKKLLNSGESLLSHDEAQGSPRSSFAYNSSDNLHKMEDPSGAGAGAGSGPRLDDRYSGAASAGGAVPGSGASTPASRDYSCDQHQPGWLGERNALTAAHPKAEPRTRVPGYHPSGDSGDWADSSG